MLKKNIWNIFYSLLFGGACLIVLSIIFSDSPVVFYSFIGVGVLLQIIGVIILKMGRK